MRFNFSKDWCVRMAETEDGASVGAGHASFGEILSTVAGDGPPVDEANVAFGRFVRLMRRKGRLTVEQLAMQADIDLADVVEIEDDSRHRPEPRTVYQLANYFSLPQGKLMQLAGLAIKKDSRLIEEAVRFAARSEPVDELAPEEQAALEAFVAVLSEKLV